MAKCLQTNKRLLLFAAVGSFITLAVLSVLMPVEHLIMSAMAMGIGWGVYGSALFINHKLKTTPRPGNFRGVRLPALVGLLLATLLPQVAFAQSTTIEIPTDVIFSSVNSWIVVFAPIAAIGIGISVALGVLTYVGITILSGIRGGSGRR